MPTKAEMESFFARFGTVAAPKPLHVSDSQDLTLPLSPPDRCYTTVVAAATAPRSLSPPLLPPDRCYTAVVAAATACYPPDRCYTPVVAAAAV
jgi:hypothetical protein